MSEWFGNIHQYRVSSSSSTLSTKTREEVEKKILFKNEAESFLEFTGVSNDNTLGGPSRLGATGLNLAHELLTLAVEDLSKNNVTAVEPGGLNGGNEELGAVRVRTSVGHGENVRAGVLKLEVLVLELGTVNRLATTTIARGKVTTLCN